MQSANIFHMSLILSLVAAIKTQLDSRSLSLQKHYLGFDNQSMKLLLFIVLLGWSEHSNGSIVFLSIFITDHFLLLIKNILEVYFGKHESLSNFVPSQGMRTDQTTV